MVFPRAKQPLAFLLDACFVISLAESSDKVERELHSKDLLEVFELELDHRAWEAGSDLSGALPLFVDGLNKLAKVARRRSVRSSHEAGASRLSEFLAWAKDRGFVDIDIAAVNRSECRRVELPNYVDATRPGFDDFEPFDKELLQRFALMPLRRGEKRLDPPDMLLYYLARTSGRWVVTNDKAFSSRAVSADATRARIGVVDYETFDLEAESNRLHRCFRPLDGKPVEPGGLLYDIYSRVVPEFDRLRITPNHSRPLAIRPGLDADLCVICRRRREGVASSAFLDLSADPSPGSHLE